MNQTRSVADARFKKLRALLELAFGSSGPLASAWGEYAGPAPFQFNDALAHVVLTVPVTPKKTGKLRVLITAINQSIDGGATVFNWGVSHGAPGTTFDYEQAAIFTPTTNGAGTPLVVRYDLLGTPILFPIGVPVQINALGQAAAGGNTQVPAHGLQMSVDEVD